MVELRRVPWDKKAPGFTRRFARDPVGEFGRWVVQTRNNPFGSQRARFRRTMAQQVFAFIPRKDRGRILWCEGLRGQLFEDVVPGYGERQFGVDAQKRFRTIAGRRPADVLGFGLTFVRWKRHDGFGFVRVGVGAKDADEVRSIFKGLEGLASNRRAWLQVVHCLRRALEGLYLNHLDARLFETYRPLDREYASTVSKRLAASTRALSGAVALKRGLQSAVEFDASNPTHIGTLVRHRHEITELATRGSSSDARALLDVLEEQELRLQELEMVREDNINLRDRGRLAEKYGIEVYPTTATDRWHARRVVNMDAWLDTACALALDLRRLWPTHSGVSCWDCVARLLGCYFPEAWQVPSIEGRDLRRRVRTEILRQRRDRMNRASVVTAKGGVTRRRPGGRRLEIRRAEVSPVARSKRPGDALVEAKLLGPFKRSSE